MAKKTTDQNIYWLAGERCLVIHRRNELLSSLQKQTGFEIKYIPECQTFHSLVSQLHSKDLFNNGDFIFVYDGKIPEPILTAKWLKDRKTKSICVFITEDDLGKNNSFNKIFLSIIEYFEPIKDSNPSKTWLSKSIKTIKKITKWTGSDDLISQVLVHSDYDCGLTISEINKVRNYHINIEDNDINFENSKDILFSMSNFIIFDFAKDIYFRRKNVFGDLDDVLISHGTIHVSQLILEGYTFMLMCKAALDRSQNEYEAIQEVVEMTGKSFNGIKFRFDMLKPVFQRLSLKKISEIIEIIDSFLKNIMLNGKDDMATARRMIFDIFSTY